jgi:hypothetical protein
MTLSKLAVKMRIVYSTAVILLISFLGFNKSWAHDIEVARFDITHNGKNDYSLAIKIDRNDLINAISTTGGGSMSIEDQIKKYISKNFGLTFNGTEVEIELNKVQYETEMIFIYGKLITKISKVNNVEIFNSCLMGLADQNNIVEFDMNDKLRSFRLTHDRTSTKFEYEY